MMQAASVIWILSAVICMGRGHHHGDHLEAADQTEQDTDFANIVSQENRHFAFRLYKQLAAHPDNEGKNIFFSPASVSLALAALSVGARGETHKQIFEGLGYNNSLLTQEKVHQAFQVLLNRANQTLSEDVSEGTAVFADHRFQVHPQFLETLKQSYYTDGFKVDFSKTKDSANTINKYVEDKTNGKIDKLVDNLDPNTVMYLISYIYYKGKWATPFDPDLTTEDKFIVNEYKNVSVQMMNMEKRLDTYYDQAINTSVLHLPFNNSYSMLLMLPDDMETLENAISPAHISKWLRWQKKSTYKIYVPKFSIKSSYSLKDVLTEMGMSDMFGDRADLSGIADEKLAVSEVVHQATLDVDEAGATAAAATGITITLMSFRHVPVLKFNRPFLVAIVSPAENILFMGKIVNPNI